MSSSEARFAQGHDTGAAHDMLDPELDTNPRRSLPNTDRRTLLSTLVKVKNTHLFPGKFSIYFAN
jgi:hypothetical protein